MFLIIKSERYVSSVLNHVIRLHRLATLRTNIREHDKESQHRNLYSFYSFRLLTCKWRPDKSVQEREQKHTHVVAHIEEPNIHWNANSRRQSLSCYREQERTLPSSSTYLARALLFVSAREIRSSFTHTPTEHPRNAFVNHCIRMHTYACVRVDMSKV